MSEMIFENFYLGADALAVPSQMAACSLLCLDFRHSATNNHLFLLVQIHESQHATQFVV